MSASSPSRLDGLDTLRACAIAWVMLFHLQLQLPPAFGMVGRYGWMGVDLFFVLSGYLIGSQLVKPYAVGSRPSLVDFYRRRVFRILPAYLFVLLLYYAWPTWREQPGISPPWQFLTFTLNYFIDYANDKAFSHAWSLCVEEHFYLLLPLVLLAMMRRPSFGKTAFAFAFLVSTGVALRALVFFHGVRPAGEMSALAYLERMYYPTHMRLDGLLVGVALALVRAFRTGWWAVVERCGHAMAAAGVLLLSLSLWLSSNRFDFGTNTAMSNVILGPLLLSLAFGLLTVSAMSRNGWLARIRIPGARTVALLAFSLYLTHKEMAHLADVYLPQLTTHRDLKTTVVYTMSCLLGAGMVYVGLERPFVLLREGLDRRRAVTVERTMLVDPAL